MIDPHTACPDWLDDAAKTEWRRWVDSDRIDRNDRETLAVYSFVAWLRQRVCEVAETLRGSGAEDGCDPERQQLVTVVGDIEERLGAELTNLAAALGIASGTREGRRPTRILILDEGPFDGAE